jgi:predicted extracellular nuclease
MSGRHSLVALAVGLALAGQAQAQLLITEYLEGSGNNKAVELSNLGSDAVDLSQYRLALYANGKPISESPTNSLALQGTLAPGASLVLANPSANGRSWPRPIRPAATWCSTATMPWCSIAAAR